MKGLITLLPLFHTVDIYANTCHFYNYLIDKKLKEKNMLIKEPFPIRKKGGYVYLLKPEYKIRKIILWDKEDQKYQYHAMEILLNPKLLLEKDNYADITYLEEIDEIYKSFSTFIDILSSTKDDSYSFSLPSLKDWKVIRVDPAIDIIVPKPQQYMELLQCGDLPKGYFIKSVQADEDEDQDDKSASFVAISKQKNITFNFYHKGKQQERRKADKKNIEKSKNKIRFEVQCKKSKIYNMVNKYRLAGNSFSSLTNHEITRDIILGYYKKLYRTGDYYSFKEAKNQIMKADMSSKKKNNLTKVLELVKHYKTICRAREIYIESNTGSKKKFNECLDLLDRINVNPVTIPKRFEKKRMESLYKKLEQQFETDKYIIYINL